MKALIIADNDAMIDVCFATLKKAGYDLIVYRWLLKALDNIEEIAPNIIIIDAISYPRHWKTLVQYTKAISDDKIDFFLFYNNPIFDDEQKKIDFFGIKSVFTSPTFSDFVEILMVISKIINLRKRQSLSSVFFLWTATK